MRVPQPWMSLAAILIPLVAAQPASAIVDPDNQGRWTKPTEKGPDKEVPGFLVNLGPTGARAILKETLVRGETRLRRLTRRQASSGSTMKSPASMASRSPSTPSASSTA